ncbi:hypothetical protein PUNSTDRAFT_139391 [Punctularia strigosozonata HHB-11173 SS5]|uniref:Uncharacterized protein n=1 Tax=Punctularia strigosozonata (strain HHB-11173) TaxID=741275 RepID=R7S1L5_PUNST|nr:uncharacterized protein PUNSTDRAFT_139391 [Punctularia strigosozonata HHB-11173 SS5]EIN03677.1 hypothetical protein PUNSTDRAFT_139391 [Punctularia strigosozonata HHB-11173 SS5]
MSASASGTTHHSARPIPNGSPRFLVAWHMHASLRPLWQPSERRAADKNKHESQAIADGLARRNVRIRHGPRPANPIEQTKLQGERGPWS